MTDKRIRIRVRGRWLRRQIRRRHDALTNRQRRRILLWCFTIFMLAGCFMLVRGCAQVTVSHVEPLTLKP